MTQHPAVEIDPLYYLHNFNQLIDTIERLHMDLLHADDRLLLARYRQLNTPAQQLYIRLVCRRATCFRHSKLHYPEIGSLATVAEELAAVGLLSINPALDADTLGELMAAAELKKALKLPGIQRKPALVAALRDRLEGAGADAATWQALLPEPELIYQPLGRESIERFRLIYFGNLRQDLSQFVVADLGLMRFESYPLDRHTRAFDRADDVDRYLQLHQFATLLESDTLPSAEQRTVIFEHSACPRLEQKRNRLIRSLGQQLERCGDMDGAIQSYRSATLPPNRERLVRALFKTAQYEAASHACDALAADLLSAEEQAFCARFKPRIERKLGGPPVRSHPARFPGEPLILPDDGQRVELQVLAYYQSQGYEGFWCENDLFNGLFGLLFWEQIFAPLPGAFSHPYQQAPLDFNSPDFAKRRAALLQTRLSELERCDLYFEARARYDRSAGTANPFVNWKRVERRHLEILCERIARPQLLQILRRIGFDHQAYRAGFPDLFLWHPKTPAYLLLEVKGPGDQLQNSQKRWFQEFETLDVRYRVCWVSRPR